MNRLTVIGLGYIGLPTATIFAEAGFDVTGVDVYEHVVDAVNDGRAHIFEPGLDSLLKTVVASGQLRASLTAVPADAFIIAVPTPFIGDHEPDLSYVKSACSVIAPVLEPGNIVILESTSPVGATEQLAAWLADARPDLTFPSAENDSLTSDEVAIAYCPERVLPGKILDELRTNDRLLGGVTDRCAQRAVELYSSVVVGTCHTTTSRTAELAKLAENAFRDVNIAYANELSIIAEKFDIDVRELIGLANKHPRVNILQPGPGVGGHCIAVDPWFIVHASPDDAQLIAQARRTNDAKPAWVADQVAFASRGLPTPTIACLGIAYKPDIDDLRQSPAIEVVRHLSSQDARLLVVEPNINVLPDSLDGLAELVSLNDALELADVLVVLVAHSQFQAVDASGVGVPIVDSVGIWTTAPPTHS